MKSEPPKAKTMFRLMDYVLLDDLINWINWVSLEQSDNYERAMTKSCLGTGFELLRVSGVCEGIGDHAISRYDEKSTSASCKLDEGLDCKLASILLIDAPIFLVKLKFISRLSLTLKVKLK
jgi:hypothetical protein